MVDNNNPGVEEIGLEAVFKNLRKFEGDLKKYVSGLDKGSKANDELGDSAKKSSKGVRAGAEAVTGFGAVLADFSGSGGGAVALIFGLTNEMLDMAGGMDDAGGSMKKLGSQMLSLVMNPIGLAITAVGVLVGGFVALGVRGSASIGVVESFDALTASANLAGDALLTNLRTASNGAVTDLEILRTTNVALAGSTEKVAQQFGETLPRFMELARAQAAATGAEVNDLFNDLVEGLKKGSPELLNNVGIIIRAEDAYESFAEANDLVVASLTNEQKQLAINTEAYAQAEVQLSQLADVQETSADKMARIQNRLANTFDALGIAVQPAFSGMLDGIDALVSGFESGARVVAPIIGEIASRVGNAMQMIIKFIKPAVDFVFGQLGRMATFLLDAGAGFALGMASIAGAMGNGLAEGANQFIFPVVIDIATFIADFLQGFSPPKKGPLSKIDEGGSNVMKAWSEGFIDGFDITPVEQVAQEVDDTLAGIGGLSHTQVASRLLQLDKAIQPFEERVQIVKSNFDALAGPAEKFLNSITQQTQQLEALVADGNEDAVKQLQLLKSKQSMAQKIVDTGKASSANAEFELTIMRSQQAQERALLNIQKNRLGPLEKEAKLEKAIAKTKKEAKKKTGAGAPEMVEETISAGVELDIPEITEEDNPLAGLDAFFGDVGANFTDTLMAGDSILEFGENAGLLGDQLDRIGSSNPVQGMLSAFGDIGTEFQTNLIDPLKEKIQDIVDFFVNPTTDPGIANMIKNMTSNNPIDAITDLFSNLDIVGQWGNISSNMNTWWTDNITTPAQNAVFDVTSALVGEDNADSLASLFNTIDAGGMEAVIPSLANAGQWWADAFIQPSLDAFDELLDPTVEGGLIAKFGNLLTVMGTSIGDVGLWWIGLFEPITQWVNGEGEGGGLPAMITEIGFQLGQIPVLMGTALQGIGMIAWNSFAVPTINSINHVLQVANDFINSLLDHPLAGFARDVLAVNLPESSELSIDTAPPGFLTAGQIPANPNATGMKTGGVAEGPGFVEFNENGKEMGFLNEGATLSVMNNEFVRSMDSLTNAITSFERVSMGIMMQGGDGGTVNNQINISGIGGNMSANDIATRLSSARAFQR